MDGLFLALAGAAASIGSLHTAAPDHWVPFVALSRARSWTTRRTAVATFLCGFGHVTVSALLGLAGLFFGVTLLESVGESMSALAPFFLIGFGVVYALRGLKHVVAPRLHGHAHSHYDHVHDESRTSVWTLFLLFSADPCVAVVPLMFAAAPLGPGRTVAIVLLYEAATIGTMLALVFFACAGTRLLRGRLLERYGDAAAGGVIASIGLVVILLGL